jgi:ABC-type branched-subunit amino acid transport system substrate-binding protein
LALSFDSHWLVVEAPIFGLFRLLALTNQGIIAMNLRVNQLASAFSQPRRRFLRSTGAASVLLGVSPFVAGQASSGRTPMVAQIVDSSVQNQDISKDFLVGSRTAWQEINALGGIRGQTIRHRVIETDGSAEQADAAWAQLRNDSSCIASFGTCADGVAVGLAVRHRADSSELAHVAPWLQSALADQIQNTFAIFSNREQQIQHALKSMSTVGVDSMTVVYQSEAERRLNAQDIQRTAQSLKLNLREQPVQADLSRQAAQISNTSVPLVLFVGGTPELVQFTRGWNRGSSLRYIIALADVNLQTAQQMIGNRHVPVIGTQAVPIVSGSLPIVRRYRQALAKYYDEPPTALSLAGYISARYTAQVLQTVRGNLSRASAYEAFARRQSMDLEGFRVAYENGKLQTAYVTQSMLSADGRVIG